MIGEVDAENQQFETRAEAVKREKELKTGFGRQWIQKHLL
jgi:hypothetical protein